MRTFHSQASGGDESVASFVRRRFGETTLREVAQPMIGGIYTADPERLSLEATMPQFLEMERHYGSVIRGLFARKKCGKKNTSRTASGPRYSLFLSYKEGMEELTRTIVSRLPEVRFPAVLRWFTGAASERQTSAHRENLLPPPPMTCKQQCWLPSPLNSPDSPRD